MRKRLEKGVRKLCWLFPQLKPEVRYSEVLSQRDVNVFAAFVNGHVKEVLCEAPFDEQARRHVASLFLRGSTGLAKVREDDVVYVGSLLAAASGKDQGLSPDERDVVDFLRDNVTWWRWLYDAYDRVVKQGVIGTCPLVVAQEPAVLRVVPLLGSVHRYQEYHKLLHESIHYVLDENGIAFHDPELDEGLVVYLHEQVAPSVRHFHYVGDEGRKYVESAEVFRKLLKKYPRSAVVPILKRLAREGLPKAEFAPSHQAL